MKYLQQYKQFKIGDQVIFIKKHFSNEIFKGNFENASLFIGYIISITGPYMDPNINKYFYKLNIQISDNMLKVISIYTLNRYNKWNIEII